MAELPPVVPGEPVDSSTFGNPVIDRVLSRYADSTARDAAVPIPQAGDFAWLIAEEQLQVYSGTEWLDMFQARGALNSVLGPGYLKIERTGSGFIVANRLGQSADGTAFDIQLSSGVLVGAGSGDGSVPLANVLNFASTRFWTGAGVVDVRLQGAANFATTATANMAIPDLGNGLIRIATSSRRYKANIEPAPELADLDLEPVSFYREDDDRNLVGFIAEDLADQDERLALYDADGEVVNFADRGLMAIMAAKINRLEARVAELEAT